MSERHWDGYDTLLERFRQEQSKAEHRFVALDLHLDYHSGGRHQDRSTARAMRTPLLACLNKTEPHSPP